MICRKPAARRGSWPWPRAWPSALNGSCRSVARMLSRAARYSSCASSIGVVVGLHLAAQHVGVGLRQRRGQPLDAHEHVAVPGRRRRARIAIATATPTKNRLSASEPSSSQREEPRDDRSGRIGRWSWPRSGQRLRARTRSGRDRRRCRRVGASPPVEMAVDAGDADDKAERSATGERRHARPGRREFPVEQHGGQRHSGIFCRGSGRQAAPARARPRPRPRRRLRGALERAREDFIRTGSSFILLVLFDHARQARGASSACRAPAMSRPPTPRCREFPPPAHCSCPRRK